MKFIDYKYEHMDIEALQEQLKAICSKLQNAASYAEFQAEEKFWQQEEQKEENSYQHRPHICGLFFYLILNDNRIFVIWNEEDIDEIF